MRIFLVRHAHADWQPNERRPLSRTGAQDALQVAAILESRSIEALVCSPYRRARQTLEPLAARLGLAIQLDKRFRERELGRWQAGSFEEAVARTWQDFDFAYPGGESNRQAQKRPIEALDDLVNSGNRQVYAIGTHGNLLALILNYFDPGIGFDFWSQLSMPDIYQLDLDGRGLERYTRV
jgi:2,3-bisphosphoglycerate-dependent phosphoglycerate mutase